MPEFPEVEALRRRSTTRCGPTPIEKAGPAHVATLKTFDPPLEALEGASLRGRRATGQEPPLPDRGRRAGAAPPPHERGPRSAYLRTGEKQPKTPGVQALVPRRGALVLTEGGPKKRAKVGLYRPEAIEEELAHLGPGGVRARRRAPGRDPRLRLAAAARLPSRPALPRRHRSRVGERDPPDREALALRAHDRARARRGRAPLGRRSTRSWRAVSSSGSAARPTRRPTASTTGWASRARAAGRRSRESTSTSTRSTTARPARPSGRILKDRRLSRLLR